MDRFTIKTPKAGSKKNASSSSPSAQQQPAIADNHAAAAAAAGDNDDTASSSNANAPPPPVTANPGAVISVLLSRTTSTPDSSTSKANSGPTNTGPVRLAVAVRQPRKRSGHADPIRYTLQHYSFLDDRRRFTNLDALLTRVGCVEVVYVACTESAKVSTKSRSSSSSSNKNQQRRATEVSDLLTKLAAVIDSRTDIVPPDDAGISSSSGSGSRPAHNDGLAQIVPTLPKPLHSPASATEFVDQTMAHLLGGDGSDRHLAYRGDKALMSDPLPKRALGLLLLRVHDANADYYSNDANANDNDGGGGVGRPVDDAARGTYEVQSGTLDSCLALDRTAFDAVNLLPPRGGSASGEATCLVGGNPSNNSIYGVLNKCKTRMGSRTLEVWLRQPLVDLEEILRRQEAVETMVEDGLNRDRLRDEGLGALSSTDLDALTARLMGATTTDEEGGSGDGQSKKLAISPTRALETLYTMWAFADKQLPALVEVLVDMIGEDGGGDGETAPPTDSEGGGAAAQDATTDTSKSALRSTLDGLNRVTSELNRCTQLVEAVLDFDAAPREFLVKPSFNEELNDIRRELDEVEVDLERVHQEMDSAWSDLSGQADGQVRLENDSNGTVWQFRLPSTNDAKLLEEFGGKVKVHRILKNGVYFSTKDLRELGTKKQDLLEEYNAQQRGIVVNAMTVGCTYAPVLERASVLIAELDVLTSLAYVAAYSPHPYVRPTMTDTEEDGCGIDLNEARHPCVELQDNVEFIPNDIRLIYGESSFLIVTGPNMGGKSTYIRSLGAIIAMAQIGSFVPCTSAKINIVHHILARVGAGDVQDRGISTFMAEMLEASSILQTATKRSLIIVDELGRGTSTFDGFGLARAISEYIVQRIGCTTVFATHFHELTVLEEREQSVKNCHVTAQRATDGSNGLTFLYEIRPGPCLDSFGIAVGEMANLPPVVIADAKRKAKQLENFDYTRKKRKGEEEAEAAADDTFGTNGDAHANAEEQAAAMNFMNDFRKMPLNSLSVDERREALRNLISTHS